MTRVIHVGDFEGEVVDVRIGGYAHMEYRIRRVKGDWPKDQDLVRTCDAGGAPFGGSVRAAAPGERVVSVFNE